MATSTPTDPVDAVDVVVVGSANLDLVATAPRLPGPGETVLGTDFGEHPGGKGLNQAVAAARAGARTVLIGLVGDDDAGRRLREVIAAEGIGAAGIGVASAPTGRALIGVDATGENSIIVVPGANGRVDPAHVLEQLPRSTVVIVQLEIPLAAVEAALRAGRERGATTILNPAPAQALDPALVSLCDIVAPNEHELALVGGVDTLLACGVGAVVVTLGAHGVRVVTADADQRLAAFTVDPIDTTGAGDAFCGALAAGLAEHVPLLEAVRFASAAGALATTVAGAVPSIPRREAIEALLLGSTTSAT